MDHYFQIEYFQIEPTALPAESDGLAQTPLPSARAIEPRDRRQM